MPHINRIRLVNVNFNDAKNTYDDFMLRLNGKSTTYDLKNTGGKSLLLLMMLQTVLPNTYLKKEKPVKNIFIGGNPKRTSHCLVEWILDEGYEYRYMLTGFCARKKQDLENSLDDNSKLEIDYYNYCYFYNNETSNDIKHLPLVENNGNEKVFMSYDKLRQLLIGLKKDGLPVEVFDSKKDYMKRIEYYGLIPAEWKLISEINVSENYIEKYFKENKTSRKLIENFLIKIIDNINAQGDETEENELADTLVELKDNLMDFKKKSDNKAEFLKLRELYSNLNFENNTLINNFKDVQNLNKKAYEAYIFKKYEMDNLNSKIQNERLQIENLINDNKNLEIDNDSLNIDMMYNDLECMEKEKNKLQNKKIELENTILELNNKLALYRAQNEYLEYMENKLKADKTLIRLDNISKNEDDIEKEYDIYGYNYKVKLNEMINNLDKSLKEKSSTRLEIIKAKELASKEEIKSRDEHTTCKNLLNNLDDNIKEKQKEIDTITQEFLSDGDMELLLDIPKSIDDNNTKLIKYRDFVKEAREKIGILDSENVKLEKRLIEIKANKTILESNKEQVDNKILEYETRKKSIDGLVRVFQVGNEIDLTEKLEYEIRENECKRNILQIDFQIKKNKLDLINKYNMIIPNEDILHLKDILSSKCNYVTTGIEKLMDMDEHTRKEFLSNNPLVIYSIFIDDESFNKFRNKNLDIEIQSLVPIASIEMLRGNINYSYNNFLFPISKELYNNINNTKIDEYKVKLEAGIELLDNKILEFRKKETELLSYLNEVKEFIKIYSEGNIEAIFAEKKAIDEKMICIENEFKISYKTIQDNKEAKEELNKSLLSLDGNISLVEKSITILENLKAFQEDLNLLKEKYKENLEKEALLNNILEENIKSRLKIEDKLEVIKDDITKLELKITEYNSSYDNVKNFNQTEILDKSFDEIRAHFDVLNNNISSSRSDILDLKEAYETYTKNTEKCRKIIEDNNFTLEYFFNKDVAFEKILDTKIQELVESIDTSDKEYSKNNDKLQESIVEYSELKGKIKNSIERLESKGKNYSIKDKLEDNDAINSKLKNNHLKITLNKTNIKNLNKKIEDIDKQVRTLDTECNGLETFITDKKIESLNFDIDASLLLKNEIYSYSKIRNESSKLDKILNKQKNNFGDYIRHIKESVENFYIKQDVLDTLKEIQIPENLNDCINIENGVGIIISQLDEKIRHIDEALKNLEGYQENFISKCFEKAETIVRDLEKLPGLSRIKIGGKYINIIKLDLYEYEKQEKLRKIKEYIFNIIEDMEKNPDEVKREPLNEKLSSKALVSQIINLDKASVKLYKIEDIQEHSTYKRWEDDLGSDGQVNAIYFMFAVCIISYISMLTRKDSSSKCKKVIIVDNPFGATSAVFLWNVMFSILRENNVQLIAPGHNINNEIISMFEVNYILKHEYYDGNRKSVVVEQELRTEEDLSSMGFEVIKGEQQSIF